MSIVVDTRDVVHGALEAWQDIDLLFRRCPPASLQSVYRMLMLHMSFAAATATATATAT